MCWNFATPKLPHFNYWLDLTFYLIPQNRSFQTIHYRTKNFVFPIVLRRIINVLPYPKYCFFWPYWILDEMLTLVVRSASKKIRDFKQKPGLGHIKYVILGSKFQEMKSSYENKTRKFLPQKMEFPRESVYEWFYPLHLRFLLFSHIDVY